MEAESWLDRCTSETLYTTVLSACFFLLGLRGNCHDNVKCFGLIDRELLLYQLDLTKCIESVEMIIGIALVVDELHKGQRLVYRYPEAVPSSVLNSTEGLLKFHQDYQSLRYLFYFCGCTSR